MKTLMATLVLFASISAQASSGQQFREDVRNVAKAANLEVVDMVPMYDAKICRLSSENSMGIVLLKSKRTGEMLALNSESFFSSKGEDNEVDSAVLVEVEGCGTRTVRF